MDQIREHQYGSDDRCMHCGLKHTVVPGETPTRWQARAA